MRQNFCRKWSWEISSSSLSGFELSVASLDETSGTLDFVLTDLSELLGSSFMAQFSLVDGR